MTQNRIGIAIVVAGLVGAPAAVLAQEPVEGEEPAEETPAEGTEGMPAPTEEPAAVMTEPEPVEAETEMAESASFGYDKGFYISHDNDKGSFKLKIGARVQTLLVVDSTEGDNSRQDKWAFSINRARLTFSGHAFTKKLGYKLQTDFGKGFVTLKDFYIDAGLNDTIWLRAGQWKRPFSRQQINSSGNLEMVDRAITDKQFKQGRDVGVVVHNGYEDAPEVEWNVGVWNGQGDKSNFTPVVDEVTGEVTNGSFSNVPKDFMPLFIGRVGLNKNGLKGYSEADLEGGSLRWGVGAAVWVEGDFDGGDNEQHQATVDAVVKVNGISASLAAFLQTLPGDTELATIGSHVQVGKVFGEKTMRMNGVARYAILMPQGDGAPDPIHEIVVGWGWLPHGHNAKLQLDLASVIDPGGAFADHLIARLQGQLSF
jgi:hypothetical protein